MSHVLRMAFHYLAKNLHVKLKKEKKRAKIKEKEISLIFTPFLSANHEFSKETEGNI